MRLVKYIEEKYYESAINFLVLADVHITNNYRVDSINLLMKITTEPIRELFLLFVMYKRNRLLRKNSLYKTTFYKERIKFNYEKLEEFVREIIILKKRNYREFLCMIERMADRRAKEYGTMSGEKDYVDTYSWSDEEDYETYDI